VRLGGDEFAVWCPNLKAIGDAETVARRLVASLADAVEVDGHSHTVGCSVGVAVVTSDDPRVGDVDKILGAADQALYRAKGAGKGRWAVDLDEPLPFPSGSPGT
jgi:diguanylate cyclase (GGDEF)-like protein